MATTHYYVSQQNGNDSNDGLSAAAAWKTLTKSMQTITTPSSGDNYICHIGAGTYRERVIPTNGGYDASSNIIYAGDPNSVYLTSDVPGRIRITGCDANEYPTNGRILDWTGKTNVEIWDVYIDGSLNDYACYNVVARRVNASSLNGFYNGTSYNCTAIGGSNGFYNGTSYNCTAIGCNTGFNSGTSYNCTAIGCSGGFYSGTQYNLNTLYVNSSSKILSKHIGVDVSTITPNYNYLFGMDRYGYPHNVNMSASSTMNLQAEVLYAFTPPNTGKSIGVQLRISSLALLGNITVELQKYVGSTWTTQKSKTISVANLTTSGEGYNYFEWDTGTGDDALTAVAGTWRYRITADGSAASTILYGSNATTPTVIGSFIPDKISTDIEGKKIYGSTINGALDAPSLSLDSTTYQTTAPSIKFTGVGEKILELPVEKNVAVTVTYQVRHNGAASGSEPQIRLQHKDITTQTATHSTGSNTWEQLSVTVTPTFDGVIDVILASRDNTKNAWFSDPSVS